MMAENDSDSRDRDFDIVLWGATGFAGRLVAEYLDGEGLEDWAIGGRNRQKLEALADDLADQSSAGQSPAIVVGDATDRASLEALASRARVVCSTVGPYAKLGSELVAACVEQGADYCDLTGEVQWIRRMIDRHHEAARREGVRIVHCCGFDSIPSDLGAAMVQQKARQRFGAPCRQLKYHVTNVRGGFSGGTLASLVNVTEEARRDPQVRRTVVHPYSLNPEGEREGPDGPPQSGVKFDEQVDAWTGPFMMATINEKIVRRSNALSGYRWGRDFSYREAVRFKRGLGGWAGAAGMAAGLGAMMGALAFGPTRGLLEKFVMPEPGEGPSRESIEGGSFHVELLGRGRDEEGATFEILGRVGADRDPGYGATAVMLGEAARCLSEDTPTGETIQSGGVLTPATAMGEALIDRLRRAGMQWEVEVRRGA